MTIMGREIIHEMLRNNGVYPGDPQMSSIWRYRHRLSGETLFAVFSNEIYNDLAVAPFVGDPILLWSQESGLTDAGKAWE